MFPNWIYYFLGRKSAKSEGGGDTPSGKFVVPDGMKFGYSSYIPENFNDFDFSNVTDFNNYFYYSTITTVPFFDTSNGTSMIRMFARCSNLTNVPLIDTSKATSCANMFEYCSNLTTIPAFNTSNCTRFNDMFSRCTNLLNVPLLDTSKATDMASMFSNCSNLVSVPNINTSNCTNFSNMFTNDSKLENVPVLDFKSVVSNRFDYMFNSCTSLTNQSLDNILQSCISINSAFPASAKKLSNLSINTKYDSIIPTLPHYQEFIDAGWIIR